MSLSRLALLPAALLLLGGAPPSAAQPTLVDLDGLEPQTVRAEAFTLARPQTLRIRATGADYRAHRGKWEQFGRELASWFRDWDGDGDYRDRRRDRREYYWPGNAWILDASTREVVWELREADTREGRDQTRTFEGDVRLGPGTYEVHYASFPARSSWSGSGSWRGDRDVYQASVMEDGRRRTRYYGGPLIESGAFEDFGIEVRGEGTRTDLAAARRAWEQAAVVKLRAGTVGREGYAAQGFAIDRPMEVELYAVGEATWDGAYDYAWLRNADTHERVWTMDYDNTDWGGGADKNRVARERLTLPAGRYAVGFTADDSHDPVRWNAVPAWDAAHWGVTVRAVNAADAARVQRFDYERFPTRDAFVSLTRMRDDEARSESFTLTRPLAVRILAMGEGTGGRRNGEMHDYGWIADARTRQRVWTMDIRDTEHAGGAQKNRLVDTVLELPAGSYTAYFVTDGSHAYNDWNAGAPMDAAFWGLTLAPARGALPAGAVTAYDPPRDPNVLARITRVRDHEHERARFRLDREADVHVFALGEVTGNEVHDGAWIEDARTGRAVWEMTARMTDPAGGARKNRQVSTTVRLPAGEYVVHYATDGSHAFGDWNADPPAEPFEWGVTVSLAQ